jgi:2-oxoisovalerate dehydrogenase E1 component
MPLLLVCEDNGIGISVPTPAGWIEAAYSDRAGLAYFSADGSDPVACYEAAVAAADHVRQRRAPAFLHLKVVRFMAHAGTDAEISYRSPTEITADYDRDPVLATAQLLAECGLATREQLLARYDDALSRVHTIAEEISGHRRLGSVEEVVAPLAPRHADQVAEAASRAGQHDERVVAFGGKLPETGDPLTLADSINRALTDALISYPQAVAFGEDVGRKGGVYGVTRGLARRFGAGRVFDTLLDEQSILGVALGAAVSGLLPIPEIQYLAYLHNAEDQLRGEAASLQFFSNGQYRNPLVLRIAGLAYQKGFGGHFHNDNAVGVLRDIPGIVIAVPSRGDDAAAMLRTCLAAASIDGTVSAFLEPIALYHSRDLHEPGDNGWASAYPAPDQWEGAHVPIGSARIYGDGADLTIVSFGNGVPMSLRVTRRLADAGVAARVLDLRWLAPLPIEDLLRAGRATGRVLVVDETRASGGVSEGVITALVDHRYDGRIARVAATDTFIPLGDAANHVLVSETQIEKAALDLLTG